MCIIKELELPKEIANLKDNEVIFGYKWLMVDLVPHLGYISPAKLFRYKEDTEYETNGATILVLRPNPLQHTFTNEKGKEEYKAGFHLYRDKNDAIKFGMSYESIVVMEFKFLKRHIQTFGLDDYDVRPLGFRRMEVEDYPETFVVSKVFDGKVIKDNRRPVYTTI